ncbi:MAG TPA: acyl-CoA desaturase [Pyrinomonadaceae bacterium]|jgi:stearoyl-CoA desaturase (delta-9 desaturase)|nr:acyl-CoA desaturase [Pyrinomonadaceae bacterium]
MHTSDKQTYGRKTGFNGINCTVLLAFHLIALLGLWFPPRPVDLILLVLFYLVSCFGITLGYHRLLTHRSYACKTWLRRVLTWMGAAAMQRGPSEWVAVHRRHHQRVDREGDPHSPVMGFFHAHMGWVMEWNPVDGTDPRKLVPDVSGSDPWMRVLDRGILFMLPWILAAVVCYAVAGWRGVLWGAIIRTVSLWHFTWCVNSVCHYWGSRPNETKDESGNVWWVGIMTLGEGWHNNHHARPQAALHGWRWYQIDLSGYVIRLMHRFGLIWNVVYAHEKTPHVLHPAAGVWHDRSVLK